MLVKKKQDKSVLFKVTILKFEPSNLYIFSLQMLDRFFHLRFSNYLYYILSSNQNLYLSTYIHLPISIQAYSYAHTIYSYPSTHLYISIYQYPSRNIHLPISFYPYLYIHIHLLYSYSCIHLHQYPSINIHLPLPIYSFSSAHLFILYLSISISPFPFRYNHR